MVGLYDLSKKGRSSSALQFTNKLTSEELKVTGTWPLLANVASFMKMNVIGFMQLGKYPVITKYYDHAFLKNNSVTNFSQNNAVENYRKYQKKTRVNNNYGLVPYNNRVVMIKKPISPNFDHSNRFLTDYLPQNFTFTYAYVATPGT